MRVMAKNLVIVESPAKAKTISPYVGKDFIVKSSFGHIRDLPKKELGVDIEHNFEPTYQISPDKKKIASELKTAAKGHTVWLATDEDREGEAIAWHICAVLGLNPENTNRIVFHEITEPAITRAIKAPRTIDQKRVDAQQARRVLDRLVGYELSPVLWKKVRAGLSAGRVQSVAVRLIVEREREIREHEHESSFKISALFETGKAELPAELPDKIKDQTGAKKFLEEVIGADFKVADVSQKPGTRSPSPPFTTSTLQQEAARRLGYSVRQTMGLAQKLYENGHITYMGTDSVIISNIAIEAAKRYIEQNFGAKYANPRQYQTKSQLAQEAHEAIRPTRLEVKSAGDAGQQKLYDLIWRRTLASQMAAAETSKTEAKISVSSRPEQLVASGEVLKFDGFIKVYGGGHEDQILPPLEKGQSLKLSRMTAQETFSRPKARYSEASLVKKLEELGIGRPSTYAPTISVIQDRGYIEKTDLEGEKRAARRMVLSGQKIEETTEEIITGADRSKLIPTQLAEIVTDFLVKYFAAVLDYDFTAKAEAEFDDIAEGKLKWPEMIDRFYKHFHPLINESNKASRSETLQVRELGVDPKSGLKIYARYGRFGPVLQKGESPPPGSKDKDAPKPVFAPLPEGTTLETVTLEQALPMFNLPRNVGVTEAGEEIIADIGRYGPYIRVGKKFISLKEHNPFKITEKEALELIKEQVQKDKDRVIADYGQLKILRGPYGPYITDGKKNARIPKDKAPEKITEEEAKKLLADAPKTKYKRRFKKPAKK